MSSADDRSEAARLLAGARWDREARVSSAVGEVVRSSVWLTADQRVALAAAISQEAPDE